MSDGIDLHALDELLAAAGAACDALDARLQQRRDEHLGYTQRALREELAQDLLRAHNVLRRLRQEIRQLRTAATENTDATSRDVAPETTEAER